MSSDILSGMSSDILSDMSSDILSGILGISSASRLRSGREHWTQIVAVRRTRRTRRMRRRKRGGDEADINSNNLHLPGGEKTKKNMAEAHDVFLWLQKRWAW